ncbi:GNAT family N-acetyltransferase [Burkholderia multivorans]|uniref:GNAT family N-acetyltransferase n=1 Tax=Burkholderia multivorans TaxID=87883 RepID=UPI000DAC69CC|nr:N-acetyltransferase [Burkholderia multivorans]
MNADALSFRPLTASDWPVVDAIYRQGIATGHATFEAEPPQSWDAFAAAKHPHLMLGATGGEGTLLGWGAAASVSSRAVYRGVVEHSIYVRPDSAGRRVGTRLLAAFLGLADRSGIWTIQASVFAENEASLRLHERAGFRAVGRRERIARMSYGPLAGRWRDTVLIEGRSGLSPELARRCRSEIVVA